MQIARSLLPQVHLSHKDKGYGFDKLADRYAAMPMQPLIVDALMVTPYVPPVHLDGLLSQAVLTAHQCAPKFGDVCVVPLPIKMLWVSPKGFPLWAVSDMLEVDESVICREYWHKRYPSHRADFGEKLNAVTTAGRWKEYRVPLDGRRVNVLRSIVLGNKDEIERLLEFVTHIGKKGAAGYGRVAQWQVSGFVADGVEDLILSSKAVPIDCEQAPKQTGKLSPSIAWTPPYWYAPNNLPCVVPR